MTNAAALGARMRRLEAEHGLTDDVARASDAQLYAIVRHGYRDLTYKHGGLPQAIDALRRTGGAADAALAEIIAQDIEGRDARRY